MKLIALDVGGKRIGVATADSAVKIAIPHGVVIVDGSELQKISEIMQKAGARHLIVGLPRNARGEETAQSLAVRTFVATLQSYFVKQKLEKPLVRFQDESLTSVLAQERLVSTKRKQRRQKTDVDSEAAAIILQDFLNEFGGEPTLLVTAKKKPKTKSRVRRRVLRILAVVGGLLVMAAAGMAIWYIEMIKPVTSDANCSEGTDVEGCVRLEFVIAEGESTGVVIDRLEADGMIRSALAFRIYLWLNHRGALIRAGTYDLRSSMSIADILQKLAKGSEAETFAITFLPGGTVAAAKKRLVAVGFGEEEIEAAFAAEYDHPVLTGKPANGSLEGYIFGETYEFYATATVGEVLMRTFDELDKVIQENNLVAAYWAKGLSLYEGLVLASIVQSEAQPKDQPGVAQVFLLRLEKNIVLGSDAVTAYAADQINPSRNKTDMSYLKTIECPWNSRRCNGLPPTPISNPGKSALLAVVNPADDNYLYFLSGDDGVTHYARTEAEHRENMRKYCGVRCNLL
jgi:UPF0755 protein